MLEGKCLGTVLLPGGEAGERVACGQSAGD